MSSAAGPDVSVIVPAYGARETLEQCIESLVSQRFSASFEIIVVASADSETELPLLPANDRVRGLTQVPRLRAAEARNLGATLARGAALVFADADVVAADDWLERLLSCSEGRWCVAGAIANGTPSSKAGTVQYLVEFFDLNPSRPGPSEHGATCNLLLPRALWQAYGPFPEDLDGCEDTWLTALLHADGLLRFAPDAVVTHLNRRRFGDVFVHQYRLGGSHARLAAKQGGLPRYAVLDSIVRTLGRIRYLYRMLRRCNPADLRAAGRLGPLIVVGFTAWGAGLGAESLRIKRQRRAEATVVRP